MDPNMMPPAQQPTWLKPEDFGTLGISPQKIEELQGQIQQAIALRNRPTQQHSTGWGAALGGLAGGINAITSQEQEKKLREALDAQLATQGKLGGQSAWNQALAARQAGDQNLELQKAWSEMLRRQQAPQPQPVMGAPMAPGGGLPPGMSQGLGLHSMF